MPDRILSRPADTTLGATHTGSLEKSLVEAGWSHANAHAFGQVKPEHLGHLLGALLLRERLVGGLLSTTASGAEWMKSH